MNDNTPTDAQTLERTKQWLQWTLTMLSDSPKSFAASIEELARGLGVTLEYKYPRYWCEETEPAD